MKEGWEVKKLGEVCLIHPQKKEARNKLKNSDLVSFIPMQDLGIEQSYVEATQVRPLEEVIKGYTYFANDDVLLAKITPCFENGKLGIAKNLSNGVGFGSSEYIVLRPKDYLYNKFLYYFLCSDKFRKEGSKRMMGTAGQKRVAKGFIKSYLIPIPPLSEQQRIVEILDEVFEGIATIKANAERNLQNACELFQSYLQDIFSNPGDDWEVKKLGQITTKIGSGATPLGGKKAYNKQGISLIRSLNVYDTSFTTKNLAFIDQNQADKLSNVIIESSDVLLNITGASIARCCIVPDKILPARVNQHVSIIRLKKDMVTPNFLHYTLISKTYKNQLLNIGEQGGTTRQALTKAQLEDFIIKYPPSLEQQEEIVTKLDALSAETKKLEAIYQQKLANLEELKKSILQKAFNGELTMNNG
jgi:type I restriction enzyme S subunit